MKQVQVMVDKNTLVIYLVPDSWEPSPTWPVFGTIVIPDQDLSQAQKALGVVGAITDIPGLSDLQQ